MITVTCHQCGVAFMRKPSGARTENLFCSMQCSAKHQASVRIPVEELFWPKVARGDPAECWLWLASVRHAPPRQRGVFNLSGKAVDAHRVAWLLCRGEIPRGLFVCHSCDETFCCNPNHLFLGTHKDNMADMIRKGRQRKPEQTSRGEAHGLSKLTVEDVLAIRASANSNMALGREYNVSADQIRKIKRHQQWRHIP